MAKHTAPETELVDETTDATPAEEVTTDETVAEEAATTEPTTKVEEADETATDDEVDETTTYLSPFKATDWVNERLAEAGLKDKDDPSKPKTIPAQMLYQYAGKGALNDGEGNAAFRDEKGKWQVSLAVLRVWTENYVSRIKGRQDKKAAKLAAELAGETEVKETELVEA
jgi:hypothetical protein